MHPLLSLFEAIMADRGDTKIINLLGGKTQHMDFHNDLFFTRTYTLGKKNLLAFTKAPFWSSRSATVKTNESTFSAV